MKFKDKEFLTLLSIILAILLIAVYAQITVKKEVIEDESKIELKNNQSFAVYYETKEDGFYFIDVSPNCKNSLLYVDRSILNKPEYGKYIATYYDSNKLELKSIKKIED